MNNHLHKNPDLKRCFVRKLDYQKYQIKINENVQDTFNKTEKVASSDKQPSPAPVQKEEEVRKPPVQQKHTKQPIAKEVVKSFEEMRKDRLKERLKQREERNINLFEQVL